jgi:hypothetical protein
VNALKALQTAAALSRVGASWTRPANATTRLFIPIGVRARGFDGALTC